MGQEQVKFGLTVRRKLDSFTEKLFSGFKDVSELKSLSYDQFIHELELMNRIFDEISSSNSPKTLQFTVEKKGPAFMWKANSIVVCTKVHRTSGTVLAHKTLSVSRFIRLYADITHQLSAVSDASGSDGLSAGDLTASLIINRIDSQSPDSELSTECCICMDNPYEVVLPCTHGYCESCIQEWKRRCEIRSTTSHQSNTPTCPICRQKVDPSANLWYLTDKSCVNRSEMPAVLIGLVDDAQSEDKVNALWRQEADPSGDQYEVSSDSSDDEYGVVRLRNPD